MKKQFSFIICCIFLASCSKIDLMPISQKSVEGYYSSQKEINEALIGAYGNLRNIYVNSSFSYGLTESRSDNAWQITLAYPDGEISQFNETPLNALLTASWDTYYNQIMVTNRIIEGVQKIELEQSLKTRYESEARFLRALCYFDLVRLFGGVPMVTNPLSISEGYQVKRSSVKEVYDLIVDDLKFAAAGLSDANTGADLGRATKWAAHGMLGKVYLFRSGYPLKLGEWNLARQEFESVIGSGKFEFFQKYADNYAYTNEGGKQQVFSVQFVYSQNGNQFPGRNAPNTISKLPVASGGFPYVGSPYQLFVSKELVNSFEQGDLRKDIAIRTSWLNNGNAVITNDPFCQKYQNGPVQSGVNSWDIDWMVLSYTDVLMMYAEVLNEIGYDAGGKAFQLLNDVRKRAGLAAKTGADVPDQASFRLWMENERRWEFCFENLRWFDLVRTDRAFDVIKAFLANYSLGQNLKSKDQYFYPLPQTVLDITPDI